MKVSALLSLLLEKEVETGVAVVRFVNFHKREVS